MTLRMRKDPKLPRGWSRKVRSIPGMPPTTFSWKQGLSVQVPDEVGNVLKDATVRRGRHDYRIFGETKDDVLTQAPTVRDALQEAIAKVNALEARLNQVQAGARPAPEDGV